MRYMGGGCSVNAAASARTFTILGFEVSRERGGCVG